MIFISILLIIPKLAPLFTTTSGRMLLEHFKSGSAIVLTHCIVISSVSSTSKLALQGQRQCFVDFAASVLSTVLGTKCVYRRDLSLQHSKILRRRCLSNHWWLAKVLDLPVFFCSLLWYLFYFISKLKTFYFLDTDLNTALKIFI